MSPPRQMRVKVFERETLGVDFTRRGWLAADWMVVLRVVFVKCYSTGSLAL
jgi:hypothetical protein